MTTLSEAKLDNSLNAVVEVIDNKLANMTIDEKKDFVNYLQAHIEDLESDIEKEYNIYHLHRYDGR